MGKFIFSFWLFFVGASSVSADAVTVKGNAYPRRVEARGEVWDLQGVDHFVYKVFFSVFTGAYYEQVEGEGKRLHFTYTRKLKAEDLREQAMKHLKSVHDPKVLDRHAKPLRGLQEAYLDVKKGDSYIITAVPGKGTWLERNDKELFSTDDGEFGLWYLKIWLGEPPIDASLKEALVSGKHL